eukprot:Seg2743.3 transcript_id=Seg2743.3/GoldUCD/mRNA.D3Y31 product="IQ domain-containing protein K" protein_id=Seg2743.3/GoldUCD/D3Y31
MYDPAISSPIYYGYEFRPIEKKEFEEKETVQILDDDAKAEIDDCKVEPFDSKVDIFDAKVSHTACYGFELIKQTNDLQATLSKEEIERKMEAQCSAKEYVENEIFPILLPALDAMLRAAIDNDVLKWKRTKFNGCDYLTEYLYNKNPKYPDREWTGLWDIPFVKRINELNPRPPLPLSLLLTDEEAAIMLQSFWRGCMVRKDPEVQELREYQRDMRDQEYDIMLKISDFWKKHPVEEVKEEIHLEIQVASDSTFADS